MLIEDLNWPPSRPDTIREVAVINGGRSGSINKLEGRWSQLVRIISRLLSVRGIACEFLPPLREPPYTHIHIYIYISGKPRNIFSHPILSHTAECVHVLKKIDLTKPHAQ